MQLVEAEVAAKADWAARWTRLERPETVQVLVLERSAARSGLPNRDVSKVGWWEADETRPEVHPTDLNQIHSMSSEVKPTGAPEGHHIVDLREGFDSKHAPWTSSIRH